MGTGGLGGGEGLGFVDGGGVLGSDEKRLAFGIAARIAIAVLRVKRITESADIVGGVRMDGYDVTRYIGHLPIFIKIT